MFLFCARDVWFVVGLPVFLYDVVGWSFVRVGTYMAAWVIGYGVIQALDGNVLVPFLFSEAVNLHPIAIILAVIVFGGMWGLWGVFFAIPLATLVKAVLNAWPGGGAEDAEVPADAVAR